MQTLIFKISNLPRALVTRTEGYTLKKYVAGIEKDIKQEDPGNEVLTWGEDGGILMLTVCATEDSAQDVKCALHNLHSAFLIS